MDTVKDALERTAATLSSSLGEVFADLGKTASAVVDVAAAGPDLPPRSEFAFLKAEFAGLIRRHSGLIIGAGIAFAPGSLAGSPQWLEWWRAQPAEEPRFVTHDLNPDSLNYYDYSTREWFTLPVQTGRPIAVGPYVDFGGINSSIITLCIPALTKQGTHVLGCDLPLSNLEGSFLRALGIMEPTVVLLGANGRVIASNSPRIATGTLLGDEDRAAIGTSLDVTPEGTGPLPWTLVALGA